MDAYLRELVIEVIGDTHQQHMYNPVANAMVRAAQTIANNPKLFADDSQTQIYQPERSNDCAVFQDSLGVAGLPPVKAFFGVVFHHVSGEDVAVNLSTNLKEYVANRDNEPAAIRIANEIRVKSNQDIHYWTLLYNRRQQLDKNSFDTWLTRQLRSYLLELGIAILMEDIGDDAAAVHYREAQEAKLVFLAGVEYVS